MGTLFVCIYDCRISLSPNVWTMTFNLELDLDLDLGLTIYSKSIISFLFVIKLKFENSSWFVSPIGDKWARYRNERMYAVMWTTSPNIITIFLPLLLTKSLKLMRRRPPTIDPMEIIILARPIKLFLWCPRCCVKLIQDGSTPAQKETSRPEYRNARLNFITLPVVSNCRHDSSDLRK